MGLVLGSFLCSIDLCVCFMPISYCFDCYSFVIQFEIRECDTSSFVLLSPDCFRYSESFAVPCRIRIVCSISVKKKKSAIGIMIGVALNLYIAL